jgi:hypothetical protein
VASTDHRGARRICRPLKSYGKFGQSFREFVMHAALHSSPQLSGAPRHTGSSAKGPEGDQHKPVAEHDEAPMKTASHRGFSVGLTGFEPATP